MKKFSYGQIWLVNFDPSFGSEYKKVRPALIVQADQYIEGSNLLTVIPISSKLDKQKELDVFLPCDNQNRLMVDSLIKTQQISSFDKGRFIKFIGETKAETIINVNAHIRLLLNL